MTILYDWRFNYNLFLLLVCSCYLKLDKFESNSASKWLAKAEQFFPYEKQVIEFKERLFSVLEQSVDQWETFLLKGIVMKIFFLFFLNYESQK